MHCPVCAHENRASAKFCDECGERFAATCSGCGTRLRPGAKFCDECGASTGTITLDDVTGQISWSFVYAAIAAPTAMHIHGPNGSAGQAAGVFVGLGVATSGGAGTLISSVTTTTANVAAIFADPTDFYVNIHNASFPGGAVRGQLGAVVPEPGALWLLSGGLAALGMRRRRIRTG